MTTDIIDLLAGIAPGSSLAAVRALRPQAKANAQRSFDELLEPGEPGSFPLAERYAVAVFVAELHGFDDAVRFYADLLSDEAPDQVERILAASSSARANGPAGTYREPGLAAESTPGPVWSADAALVERLGERLVAGLVHAHLLVIRPRESGPDALRALVRAGWSADDIVSLSQLVSFLAFQLRLAWGLRVLGDAPAAGADSTMTRSTESDLSGATR